ncbi:hypothetical protein HNQ62_003061 [Sulfurisphaera ohwakuensis]|uniref:Uncharacterized protein n=1 Tax=Sulfurisphaera ohwakuensis TaxID=69656 RepID=A0A7J9RXT8_SULOH|nr:hypothetical protein [Sulfurisphaera ohwakuensis]
MAISTASSPSTPKRSKRVAGFSMLILSPLTTNSIISPSFIPSFSLISLGITIILSYQPLLYVFPWINIIL